MREKLTTRKEYLSALNDFKAKYEKALEFDADMAQDYDFPKRAFQQATNRTIYHPKTNGLHVPLPTNKVLSRKDAMTQRRKKL